MIRPWHIYEEAEEQGIQVHFLRFEEVVAMTVPGHMAIDTEKLATTAEETTVAAHELAHSCTGSYYGADATAEERQKQENAADRYAIRRYLPPEQLQQAVDSGLTECWQLADYFGFTEDFIRKAICFYRCGNLADEQFLVHD